VVVSWGISSDLLAEEEEKERRRKLGEGGNGRGPERGDMEEGSR
jgi:hypothetical protein